MSLKVQASFDDGSVDDLQIAHYMDHFGIDTTFFIPVNWRKYLTAKGLEPLTEEQLRLIGSRFEIGSHGVNHELLTRVDDATQEREIADSKAAFEEMFSRKIERFCYPRGYYDESIKQKVRAAGYKSARTVKVGHLRPAHDPFISHTTVHVGYDRAEYGDSDWYEYGLIMMLEAMELANNGKRVIYHLWGHSAEITKYDQWDRLEKFLKVLSENILS